MDFFQHLTFDQATLQFFRELLIVLGIGFLLGLEREFSKSKDAKEQKLFAGVRTFPLVAIMGYLAVFLSRELSNWFYIAAFLSIFGMLGLAYRFMAKKGDQGGTSEFALLLCFVR